MEDPTTTTPGSIMPRYPWLLTDRLEFEAIQHKVDVMTMLGVPYGDAVVHAEEMAREQARDLARDIKSQGGPSNLDDRKIIALIAYLQRLGTDIRSAPPVEVPKGGPPTVKANSTSNRALARAGAK
jgi:cytochrome c oxidase cbb3-type subunit I/II